MATETMRPVPKGGPFVCAQCKVEFLAGWTEAEAVEEHAALFPEAGPKADLAVLCSDCHRRFMKWLEQHPEVRSRHGF